MPITPKGTEYESVTFTPDGGSASTYTAPVGAINDGDQVNLLVHCHGSGAEHNDMSESPTWADMLHRLMDTGWAVVESHAYDESWATVQNNWGAPTAVNHYRLAYERAVANLNVNKVAVQGRSMGGIVAINVFLKDPVISDRAEALVLNSATQDLTYRTIGQDVGLGQFRIPYGYSEQEFIDALPEIDPMLYPLEWWQGKRVLQIIGDEDDLVPAELHGLKMRARTHGVLAMSRLVVAYGAGHGSDGGHSKGKEAVQFLNDAVYGIASPVRSMYANMGGTMEPVHVPTARMK